MSKGNKKVIFSTRDRFTVHANKGSPLLKYCCCYYSRLCWYRFCRKKSEERARKVELVRRRSWILYIFVFLLCHFFFLLLRLLYVGILHQEFCCWHFVNIYRHGMHRRIHLQTQTYPAYKRVELFFHRLHVSRSSSAGICEFFLLLFCCFHRYVGRSRNCA